MADNGFLNTQSYDMYLVSIEISNKIKDNEIIEKLELLSKNKNYFIVERNYDNILLINNNEDSILSIFRNLFYSKPKNYYCLRINFSKNTKNGIKILEIYKVKGNMEIILKFIKYLKNEFSKMSQKIINKKGNINIIDNSKISLK